MLKHITKRDIVAQAARLMHDTHLRYQRDALAGDKLADDVRLPSLELRGCRVADIPMQSWQPHWMTGLRPNFWIGYFDTLSRCAK